MALYNEKTKLPKKRERKQRNMVEIKVKPKYTKISYEQIAEMENLSLHFPRLWNCSQRYSVQ